MLLTFVLCSSAAYGGVVGTVTHVSGPLSVRKADGSVKALYINSTVEEGDTLMTEKRTYARIKLKDNSDITLRPGTRFTVEQYAFDKEHPKDDTAVFNLIKGGLRTVTGQIGKRGNPDSYRMKTPTATIGVRGTSYGATFCQQNCGSLPDGLYIDVSDGTIVVYNKAGSQMYNVGQFGYVSGPGGAPVVLPGRPAVPSFTPPPSVPPPPPAGSPPPSPQPRSGCEVR
jgi:hypothetical protein